MKLISWNVNGLRACLQKGFLESAASLHADIICLQETKMQQGQAQVELPDYLPYWNSAEKKGYSGTAVFTKKKPINVMYGLPQEEHNQEGRAITLEFESFFLVNVYVPNAQEGLKRLDYRMTWEDAFRAHLQALDAKKPVILCGDLNVAFRDIDLKNPKTNHRNPGFTDEERGKLAELFGAGFTDTFRAKYPDLEGAYSWWSYRFHAREKNVGWRIDYFIVSDRLAPHIQEAAIHSEIFGSDHCPVELQLDV